uniref:Uncharacterized protein n=1 Tax=Fagus sylvatica TaxID=28930 RepID=A0A2N9FAD0_FAGSY
MNMRLDITCDITPSKMAFEEAAYVLDPQNIVVPIKNNRINVSNWQEWVSGRGARSAYKVDHGASARICDQEYVEILTGAWRRVISRMATKFLKTEERAPSRRTLVLVRRNVRESQIKNWCVAVRTEVFYCKIFGDRIAGSDEQSSR